MERDGEEGEILDCSCFGFKNSCFEAQSDILPVLSPPFPLVPRLRQGLTVAAAVTAVQSAFSTVLVLFSRWKVVKHENQLTIFTDISVGDNR